MMNPFTMQPKWAFTACLAVLFFAPMVAFGQGQIRVGLAQADITPPIGGKTTGYSSAKPTDGIHDPVTARVVVLQSEEACVAIVSCDLCIYNSPALHDQVKQLGVDRLLLHNTHTHAGPKMDEDFPSAENPWRQTVDQRILSAIQEAKNDMFQGYFAASETQIQLGYNRLIQRGDYALTYFENPERIPYGQVDPTVGVIRITDDAGKARAVLVHYACHPVVLGPRNIKISADYPGVVRRIIEERIGDDCMCVFLQGGAGDINPLFLARGEDRSLDFPVVERMGEMLAAEVSRALALIEDQPGRSERFAAASSETSFTHRFEESAGVRLGVSTLLINDDIAFISMPGEPFHKFGLDIRQLSGVPNMYLLGYCCNGNYEWPSYLPDLASAARGGYGASENTKAEVGAGERLITDGIVQLYKLQGRLKSEPMRDTFEEPPK
ncbi:MAG: neutral/alkaline non-lysosomal ceramidase N-terminal domain-containing protein [bacterium]|nr:neutral/alkaline non-lysosomal ceramidase N-terminal domain-containing protein [bacterium]